MVRWVRKELTACNTARTGVLRHTHHHSSTGVPVVAAGHSQPRRSRLPWLPPASTSLSAVQLRLPHTSAGCREILQQVTGHDALVGRSRQRRGERGAAPHVVCKDVMGMAVTLLAVLLEEQGKV